MGVFQKLQTVFQSNRKLVIQQRFELLKEAVSGTMSNFYMARDRESDRIVGLKVGIREKVEFFESRFKGLNKPPEGQIAQTFDHPRIVQTYEYGRTSDDVPFIVMQYVRGFGMHMMLNNHDPNLAGNELELVRQMAEALNVVHKAGYIHRDVCPRNFICAEDGKTLTLIDFGLTLPATTEFMRPGNRTGTPLYMAPEVVRRRDTDKRLDIFSFGVTAFHLCTGELPWPGGETSGLAAMSHDTVEPTDIFSLRPNMNPKLARVITRCMAPNRDNRPVEFDAILRELRPLKSFDK
ncbi:MAG: protein kinase [Planctomycetaceae bacterium]|nr:protein kinase [Planctomycetaceae bacterium]